MTRTMIYESAIVYFKYCRASADLPCAGGLSRRCLCRLLSAWCYISRSSRATNYSTLNMYCYCTQCLILNSTGDHTTPERRKSGGSGHRAYIAFPPSWYERCGPLRRMVSPSQPLVGCSSLAFCTEDYCATLSRIFLHVDKDSDGAVTPFGLLR